MNVPAHNTPFLLDGKRCQPLGRGLILREDRMVGFVSAWHAPQTDADVSWFSPAQLAERARLPLHQIVARLKDKWGAGDIIKPDGWEHVVRARRFGLTDGKGTKRTLKDWAARCNTVVATLEYRLLRGYDVDRVLAASLQREEGAGIDGPPPQITASGGVRGRFLFNGAVDNLTGHCRTLGVTETTVRKRIQRGMTLEQAMTTRRMPRSDRGKPNPKRSPYAWDIESFLARKGAQAHTDVVARDPNFSPPDAPSQDAPAAHEAAHTAPTLPTPSPTPPDAPTPALAAILGGS